MSEQPNNVYDLNEYRRVDSDGALEMDHKTDVWLKASELPLSQPKVEAAPVRELTEQQKLTIEIQKAAHKLHILNIERSQRQAA